MLKVFNPLRIIVMRLSPSIPTLPELWTLKVAFPGAGEWQLWLIDNENREDCALTRAGGSLDTITLKSVCKKPDLSLPESRGL